MIEVTAFNWTYWIKVCLWFAVFFAGVIIPTQVYSTFRNGRSIAHKKTIIIFLVVAVIHFSYFYVRLPNLINEFENNKITLSGKLCGFKGSTEWYSICIDGKTFHSYQAARNMFNDAIFNFGWMDKPTGCVEIEYLNLGEEKSTKGRPPYTEVAIGLIREIPCKVN